MSLTLLWKRAAPFILLTSILSVALSGCNGIGRRQIQASEVAIAFAVNPHPPGVGPSQLTVTLSDAGGAPLEGAAVKVEGTMAHDGMQPLLASFRATEAGTYQAPFSWTMSGDWLMAVTATLPGGQEVARRFDVTVAGGTDMGAGHHNHSAENQSQRIPNEGAAIRIVSPQDGAIFEKGSEVKVEIETIDFDLGQSGQHWHVYIDGGSSKMIMGGMSEAILRDLEPGRHELSTYLSVGSAHDELEAGARVTVTIIDPSTGEPNPNMEGHQKEESGHKHN